MWIFTKHGFFSAVCARQGNGKHGQLVDLERLGSVVAYRLVKQHQPKASINLRWASATGLKGKDWRELTEATKIRLRREVEAE